MYHSPLSASKQPSRPKRRPVALPQFVSNNTRCSSSFRSHRFLKPNLHNGLVRVHSMFASILGCTAEAGCSLPQKPAPVMALPMPTPTVPPLPLSEYKILSFDIYGTIIEYKQHVLRSFRPLLDRIPAGSPYLNSAPLTERSDSATKGDIEFLKLFQKHEDAIKLELGEKPLRFDAIMQEIWRRIAAELKVSTSEEEVVSFGSKETIASWPTFDGTFEALSYLSSRYRLVALSNIDKFAWNITAASDKSSLGEILWYKVFTAEDFGTDMKRADDAKLEKLVEFVTSEGFEKSQILHVAQSLGHDHAPAKRQGLSSVFLVGDGPVWGKETESKMAVEKELVGYAWRRANLGEFAELVKKEFQE